MGSVTRAMRSPCHAIACPTEEAMANLIDCLRSDLDDARQLANQHFEQAIQNGAKANAMRAAAKKLQETLEFIRDNGATSTKEMLVQVANDALLAVANLRALGNQDDLFGSAA